MNAVVSVRAAARRACSACGASYSEGEWVALEVSERLGPRELRRLVLDWPEAVCIEVRRCTSCGHPIAAKRAVPSP
jgi:hypothetical protein